MNEMALYDMSDETFEQLVDQHITWAMSWVGTLPADTFFGLWAEWQQPKQRLELQAQVVEGQLKISVPENSPLTVIDNRIYLDNGLELAIKLS